MKKIIIPIIILVFVLIPVSFYFVYQGAVSSTGDATNEKHLFEIKPGENVKDIASNLLSEHLIDSPFFFETFVWQKEIGSKLQAGRYELREGMSIAQIVDKFVKGDIMAQERNIKMLEGWTIADMEKYLKENNIAAADKFADLANAPLDKWPLSFPKPDFLKEAKAGSLEGYLFPDTYRIYEKAGAEDVIAKMLNNFGNKLTKELREEIIRQNKTLPEIITMASIIEKEVMTEKDSAIVAGILYKRLDLGMRLEVDSTINYLSGKNDPSATYEDLQIDSPYNTYKNGGLPPGPISNPSLRAIKAAIYPEVSPYLFYLNRQDTGETIFSKNFDEHIANKNKYLK